MTLQEQQFVLSEYYLNLKKKEYNLKFYQHPKKTKGYRGMDLSNYWILKGNKKYNYWGTNWPTKKECWKGNILEISQKFDFLNNLNDIHLLEKSLTDEGYEIFKEHLYNLCYENCGRVISSDVSKRAEALLKTLNFWKHDK